jgi:hypothetical protein
MPQTIQSLKIGAQPKERIGRSGKAENLPKNWPQPKIISTNELNQYPHRDGQYRQVELRFEEGLTDGPKDR